jgi:hypothetical protein
LKVSWVKGHQDPYKQWLELSLEAKANCITDNVWLYGNNNFRMNTGIVDMVPLIIWLL